MLNKIMIFVMMGLMLGACGRMSSPKPPEGSNYERPYSVSQNDK